MTLFNQKLNRHSTNKQSNRQLIKPVLIKRNKMLSLFRRLSLSLVCGAVALIPVEVVAQISPDGSVPTTVEEIEEIMRINGGEREGNNLFHSFEEFSILEGMEAVFENALDIENIFARITGESASAINGILSSQGSANFFLINPNGIIFGENASLDVGGSFIATTADSVEFEDGAEFSADPTQDKPILKVSVPIGLQFEGNNGAIAVNGDASQINRQPDIAQFNPFERGNYLTGLSVSSGETLALIGGEINVEGGKLYTESGQINLGGVTSGEVKINPIQSGFSFSYENFLNFQDVNLSGKASVDVSGNAGGSIGVNGANVKLTDGSVLLNQNNGSVSSGNINVNASESLILIGAAQDQTVSSIVSETLNDGDAANIQVTAKNLLLQDGGNIVSTTFGIGKGGEIDINASDSIQLLRTPDGFIERAPSRIASPNYNTGDSGGISISTSSLKASNGSSIATGGALGSGNGGSIDIQASSIKLDGLTEKDGLFTTIISAAFGTGNAGNLTIDTSTLKLTNGATVSTDSRNIGTAGNVTINASESIEISGSDPNTNNLSAVSSSVTLEENEVFQQSLDVPLSPGGNAGGVTINTPVLNVNSGGEVSVKNQGTGNAGTLSIDSDSINLDNIGSITAKTASGQGGNITIDTESLQIHEGSKITARAQNNGDGGNITINTNTLIAKKNTQVTANAFNGRGGNLEINAEGLFLFDSPQNIFSASSELGIDGTIKINAPDLDLQKELE
jgi:filamentous hemagglutinin family protein